ncbi:3-phosphoglycerate dehydrogenase [Roseomonas gilardii]|uniref:3-phosphoglycerate dehydrogenase n=1 Tax=Roseomonas gilardii TaxID=257708 RepID=A0A1L7AMB4_9PROT|nr:hydroxyacid dehydrogenase [Roseomonas gilardii]APT59923.1 3-phosphoglycerate dehydrogenase [Roseomonas gilardii]
MGSSKIVARFDLWYHPAMAERFAAEPGLELLTLPLAGEDSLAQLARAHAYQISSAKDELPRRWFADAALLRECPRLLCVSTNGAGYDTVDVPACTDAGVLVVNQAGANAQAVAEHTLGLMLGLTKRVVETDRMLRTERGFSREDLMGRELAGRTLGLVGIGHVGRRVAAIAAAFGMTVLATDPGLPPEEIGCRGAEPVLFGELLARADIVSLHCPRGPETLGLMDDAAFARMRPGALFVSTARGGIHDEAALERALRSGHLGGAGLDVWEVEPPPMDHPLLGLRNVIATFHTAGVTGEARRNMALSAATQVIAALHGERPPHVVNPEVWPRFLERRDKVLGA